MQDLSPNQWMRRTTLLCLVLLCITGLAQALHSHSQDLVRGDVRNDADKTRCTICVAGHAPQQASAAVQLHLDEARVFTASTHARPLLTLFAGEATRIRPPPAL